MLFSQYHLVRIASNNFISISYPKFLFNLITSFKINWYVLLLRKNNKQTKKPVNCFFAGWCKCRYTVSADLYWNKTLPKPIKRTIAGTNLAQTLLNPSKVTWYGPFLLHVSVVFVNSKNVVFRIELFSWNHNIFRQDLIMWFSKNSRFSCFSSFNSIQIRFLS